MNNQNQKPNLPKKPNEESEEKRQRINRTIYISAVALILALAVIIGITSAMNRAKKKPTETPSDKVTMPEIPTLPNKESEKEPNEESKTESTESESKKDPDKDVVSKLPDFVLPVKGALSVKHNPDLQVFSPTMGDYRVHIGIDINTEKGAKVCSAAEGVVSKIWEDALMGTCVAVAHEGKSCTYYKNLDENLAENIKEGASVKAGQVIGAVGETAMVEVAQEPHLHFEITVNGLQEDPLKYFDKDVIAKLESDKGYEG